MKPRSRDIHTTKGLQVFRQHKNERQFQRDELDLINSAVTSHRSFRIFGDVMSGQMVKVTALRALK